MKAIKLSIIAALLLAGLPANSAQAGWDGCAQVPLLESGGMIEVPVTAFGRTLYFVMDTGFSMSAIDTRYAQYLGNQVDTYSATTPLGSEKNVAIYQCPDISIAGRPLALNTIAGLDLHMMRLISGEPCDGVLGMDWFAKNVVSLDFDKKTFSISDTTPPIVSNTFEAEPLELYNGGCFMKALVNQDQILDLMVDTGDSSSLSLNQDTWQSVFSTSPTMTTDATVADAVNRVARTKVGVVKSLALENLYYTNLHATYINNPSQPSRLGLAFFERHNVTFDFAHGMLYLQPGQNFTVPDVEDMSGLHLLRDGGTTTVYSVDENSPASAVGIMANDVIETVNQQPAASLTMKSIRQQLRSGDGDQVNLQVRRGNSVKDVRLVLQNQFANSMLAVPLSYGLPNR